MGDPEKIWVVFEEHINPKDKRPYVYASSSPTKGIPYIPESLAQAMVAAAYDAAMRAAFRAGKSVHSGYRDENERIAQRIENELRLEVQKAIRQRANTDARAALEARDKRVREDALREAAEAAHDHKGITANSNWTSEEIEGYEAGQIDIQRSISSAILALIDRTAEGDV